MNEIVRENLKKFRDEADLTTEQAAQASGIPVDNIRRYENGGSGVPSDVLFKLAEVYGHKMDDFFQENPPKADLSNRPVFFLRTLPGVEIDEKDHRKLQEMVNRVNAEVRAKRTRKAPKPSDGK